MSNGMSPSSELNTILVIAGNEFKRIVFDPLSIVVFIFLILLMFLNGLSTSPSPGWTGDLTTASLHNAFYSMGQYLAAVAIFIGATSLAEEHSRHSLSILLTKPVYRRSIILGKMLGLNVYLLVFIPVIYLVYSLELLNTIGFPASWTDFILTFISIVLTLFLESSLAMGLAMLTGVLFKKVLHATLVSVTLFFIVWYSPFLNDLGIYSMLSPFMLSFQIMMSDMSSAILLLIFLALEIIVVLTVDCVVFIRTGET
jgi:ABC-2 type transport system permease protein